MCALRRLPRQHLAPATERFWSIRGAQLCLDDVESVHHLLKERARRVIIRVGVDGVADEVEDLRDTKPSDLDYVCFITEEPRVKVRLGVVPYVSAGDDQDDRELARDVHSLISVRQRPGWQKIAAISGVNILGFGPAAMFLAVLLADGLGLISPSDRTRSLVGSVMLPAVSVGLLGAAIAYKQWLKVDYATPVLAERWREIRSRSVQGKSGLAFGIALAVISSLLTLVLALLTASSVSRRRPACATGARRAFVGVLFVRPHCWTGRVAAQVLRLGLPTTLRFSARQSPGAAERGADRSGRVPGAARGGPRQRVATLIQ